MDTFHFIDWIDQFIHKKETNKGLFHSRRHLLILDGHKSHISLEVLYKLKSVTLI